MTPSKDRLNIQSTKESIRKEMHKFRKDLSKGDQRSRSLFIQEQAIQFIVNLRVRQIISYKHYNGEVETDFLNKFILHHGIVLGLPRVEGSQISFYKISSLAHDLEEGYSRILEPKKTLSKTNFDSIELALIPGLAFDCSGSRLGYGKGFYDRFLRQYPGIMKVGLAFKEQVLEKVPVEEQDEKMDYIIIEDYIYDIRKRQNKY
ncbi:MAG: 5-formyltetrahydrofolate cyclo-ligase [bacterium]|nr:MAG: 5-formyltetrahydrofolate cyclo-ligase [bacterium]